MKKANARLIIGSLVFASVLLTGTIVPISCTKAGSEGTGNTQNQDPNQNDPGQGNAQSVESKFAPSNKLLNAPNNPIAADLYNQYIFAISSIDGVEGNESQPPQHDTGVLNKIPPVPDINQVAVNTKADQIVKNDDFINELISMFRTDLVADGLEAGYLTTLISNMENVKLDMKKVAQTEPDPKSAGSVWSNYFALAAQSTGQDPVWTYRDATGRDVYSLYFPSDHLSVTYSNEGYPILTNNPADATAEESSKVRLVVHGDQSADPQTADTTLLFKTGTINFPKSFFKQFPDFYWRFINEYESLKNQLQNILNAYKAISSGNGLGLSWWDQMMVTNDQRKANSTYIQNDLKSSTSKILAWIKSNAAASTNIGSIPDSLQVSDDGAIALSETASPYYSGDDSGFVFSVQDATQTTYSLYLEVADFQFSPVVNNYFDSTVPFIDVKPEIKLGAGSRLDITSGTEPTLNSVSLNANS